MPYYDSTLIAVSNYTRGWYKMDSGKTLGFAVSLPNNYNSEQSYPLILSYGGSQNGLDDVYGGSPIGMFDSNSVTTYLNEDSYPYANGEGYIILAFQSCTGANGADAFLPEGIVQMVEEIITASNILTYYTKWGTADDGEGYSHSGLWSMPTDANPNTIGSSSNIFVNIDTDRIYFTGFSLGSTLASHIAYYGRDLLAAVMPYEGGPLPHTRLDEFYDYVEGLLSSSDNNLVISDYALEDNYYGNAIGNVVQPSLWDMTTHDFADGTPGTSLLYSEGNRKRIIFIKEELFKSFKHLPIIAIQSWNSAGQGPARNAQSLQEALYIWNNKKDLTWNTFIAVNSIKSGSDWVGHAHGSQIMWESVFGGLSSGYLHVFDPNIDDVDHAIGLTPVLPENKGDAVTCLEWLLSKRKSTNPAVEDFDGWPDNNWLTITLPESETTFVFDTYHSLEHHADGKESLNYSHFLRFEKSGSDVVVRDFNHNVLATIPPDSSQSFTFDIKNYTVVRTGDDTRLITPQKYLIT